MRDSVALQRYLQRHIEKDLPRYEGAGEAWQQVLVLPAYREEAALLQRLQALPTGAGRSLVVLVLNRPESDCDTGANHELREAVQHRTEVRKQHSLPLLSLNDHTDLYLLDLETEQGPTPADQGVGLARKVGCDLALGWMVTGAIRTQWICSLDADAELPASYFHQLDRAESDTAAAVFPFRHIPGGDPAGDEATALYELRLHHHVLGLEYAGSPYAFHTLGSCLAVRANVYAQVRGFPRRAGAEDFYLLNKAAKVGSIARLQGECVRIHSRLSSRVPFGTGPAVQSIANNDNPGETPIFYHPHCYVALRALLSSVPLLAAGAGADLHSSLVQQGLRENAAQQVTKVLQDMGLEQALHHCRRQGKTSSQFLQQFHQWFDGFRTLRFIHALRDADWPLQTLQQLQTLEPRLWPVDDASHTDVATLRACTARHWGWR